MTNVEVRTAWRAEVESALDWRRAVDQTGSGTGVLSGYVVEASPFPRRGFLKPGRTLASPERLKRHAAREKIAADIAGDLDMPVPPAVLFRSIAVGEHSVITLFLHPFQLEWPAVVFEGFVPPRTSDADKARILAESTRVLALDTWLDQYDHGDAHAGNVVWGYGPEGSELVFLDYASSMGADGSWRADGWQSVEIAPFPRHLLARLDDDLLEAAIERIEHFPRSAIEEIVGRIPSGFLPEPEKAMLTVALVGRRGLAARRLREGKIR